MKKIIKNKEQNSFQKKIFNIIFESDTITGRLFDIILIVSIIISVLTVFLDSVQSLHFRFKYIFYSIEWFFTILFTIEFFLRIYCVKIKRNYIFSFFGVIDIISILPTYLSLVFTGIQALLIIRVLRVLRFFRIFKLSQYVGEANLLMKAIKSSRYKITVFLFSIMSIIFVIASFMYLVEGPENGFTSIPKSIYWAIVTLTTVGFGDITPKTILGQTLASIIMILGYGILAVPTGIVTSELIKASKEKTNLKTCISCSFENHDEDAKYCKHCGTKITD